MRRVEPSRGTARPGHEPTPPAPVESWLAARLDSAVSRHEALRRTHRALLGERRHLLATRRALLSEIHAQLGQARDGRRRRRPPDDGPR